MTEAIIYAALTAAYGLLSYLLFALFAGLNIFEWSLTAQIVWAALSVGPSVRMFFAARSSEHE